MSKSSSSSAQSPSQLVQPFDMQGELLKIDVNLQGHIKALGAAISQDDRCYLSQRDLQMQELISRVHFQLVGARVAIADFRKLNTPNGPTDYAY